MFDLAELEKKVADTKALWCIILIKIYTIVYTVVYIVNYKEQIW